MRYRGYSIYKKLFRHFSTLPLNSYFFSVAPSINFFSSRSFLYIVSWIFMITFISDIRDWVKSSKFSSEISHLSFWFSQQCSLHSSSLVPGAYSSKATSILVFLLRGLGCERKIGDPCYFLLLGSYFGLWRESDSWAHQLARGVLVKPRSSDWAEALVATWCTRVLFGMSELKIMEFKYGWRSREEVAKMSDSVTEVSSSPNVSLSGHLLSEPRAILNDKIA